LLDIPTDLLQSATHAVFVGPSYSPNRISTPIGRVVLKPVVRGDVDALLASCPHLEAIGIIDGKFMTSFSISPKEILRAIDAGKRVYGSSSMGALRATELAAYGMVGVGAIYGLYASCAVDSDDEVAMTFDPETLEATSEPLVNIRITLQRACLAHRLSSRTAEIALKAIKQVFYPNRTYRTMLDMVRGSLDESEYLSLLKTCENCINAKEEDARLLLNLMGWSTESMLPPKE
jgi:TfuA protein